jgi:cellobiose phosphorylase
MLYGFLGFEPTPTGFTIDPRLPKDWPGLTITGIHLHDTILDVAVAGSVITVTATKMPTTPIVVRPLAGQWRVAVAGPGREKITVAQ